MLFCFHNLKQKTIKDHTKDYANVSLQIYVHLKNFQIKFELKLNFNYIWTQIKFQVNLNSN
jgi:hypothetical protein